jgi:hypothetical protein
MRTLLKVAVASLIAATAMGTTPVVQAQGFSIDAPGVHVGVGDRYHRRYYDYDRMTVAGAHGTAADRVGPSRVASAGPIEDQLVQVGATDKAD